MAHCLKRVSRWTPPFKVNLYRLLLSLKAEHIGVFSTIATTGSECFSELHQKVRFVIDLGGISVKQKQNFCVIETKDIFKVPIPIV
jgi:hypothetical protein